MGSLSVADPWPSPASAPPASRSSLQVAVVPPSRATSHSESNSATRASPPEVEVW